MVTAGRVVTLLVVVAIIAGGVWVQRALDETRAQPPAGTTAQHAATTSLPPATALQTPPPQAEVGPLPEPAGASRVDLGRPSLLTERLRPAPRAGLAFDFADGRVLWRRGATRRHPIASLTKLMTALLAVERFGPHDLVRIPRRADSIGGSRMGGLRPGRRVRAEVLLEGLLISSGNDAAVTLAIAGAGSERAWVALMNRRAKLLGLRCTRFVDSHGLAPGDLSCAADVAALAMRAVAEPRIARIARRRYARVWPGAGRKLTLRTTNHLVRERYPGAIGLKTGYTSLAGFCLVAVVERGDRRIGIVLLGSRNTWADARRLTRAAVRAGALPAAV